MDSSARLFNRERTLHQILGEGFDVMLWRRRNVTVGILFVTLAAWVVFERSGYTLLSLLASVFLLLFVILFLWAKAAAILNRAVNLGQKSYIVTGLEYRPPPPLPNLQLPEEMVNEVAACVRSRVNTLLSVSHDIAMGRDPKLFFKVAASLCVISVIGGCTDFLTLGYTTLVIVLTVPAIYEKYEDHIDRYSIMGYMEFRRLYARLDAECFSKIRKWILEKRKLN
ncbi:reticulon family protein isoform X2 [Tasmannia lanceolata]|uniref:reticulon family protein isoform X2 n=1 Tax=Tasmannia lanceolata TaxID=3420 RepID=UPI004063E823